MDILSLFSKLILFISSYVPLGIILLVSDFDKSEFPFFTYKYYSFSLFLVIILVILLLIILGRHFFKMPAGWVNKRVVSAENMNSQILSYIFSYILPFLSYTAGRQIIIAILLLIMIGILYMRSDMIGINPMLSIFGYNIIRVKWYIGNSSETEDAIVISKFDAYSVKQLRIVKTFQIRNELYLLKKSGGDNDRH
jgi:hypothetical protein